MKITGRTLKVGDDIDTDLIIPGRYLQITDMDELKEHIFEDLDEVNSDKITTETILIAGKNFGSGSSREHAPQVIKAAGISAIVAKSFARIFFRNSINIGLPVFISLEAPEKINSDTSIEINTTENKITTVNGKEYNMKSYPKFIENLINKGGILEYTKEKISNQKKR